MSFAKYARYLNLARTDGQTSGYGILVLEMERKQPRNRSIHQLSAFDSNNTHNGVATLEEAAHRLQRKSGNGSAHARRDKATSSAESQRMRGGRSRIMF